MSVNTDKKNFASVSVKLVPLATFSDHIQMMLLEFKGENRTLFIAAHPWAVGLVAISVRECFGVR